ncbi:hypothetical protein [Acidianus ambivalens]|uniref:Uncharacterized protein n=1 Tax=Acidianus ambivalens TaxID=2283 RepID=A0A650CVT9_ACIAM|nr:hypothetical protein [Acidianus ambivalens]MQL55668.1 hypothetical protein [Acidianus ambivalens]QGR21752.1 hypothetical protein D1866_06885 [Acidianus ambivalens]
MKLSSRALEKLKSYGNYSISENGNDIIISYVTPSLLDASSIEGEDFRIVEIHCKKDNEGNLQILYAEIKDESNEVIRKMNLDELEPWIEYLESSDA